jgi:hypothetical protein
MPLSLSALHPALGILDRDEFLVLTSWFLRLLLPVAPQKQLLLRGHQVLGE